MGGNQVAAEVCVKPTLVDSVVALSTASCALYNLTCTHYGSQLLCLLLLML